MGEPSLSVVDKLGVCLPVSLGGRCNQHWRVSRSGEQWVLRRWAPQAAESIEFERMLVAGLAKRGWPVACLEEPVEIEGALWSLAPLLPGAPPDGGHAYEPRARGRLLAEFHQATVRIPALGQRPGWRRCEEILTDPVLDQTLSESEVVRPEEVKIVRWHLARARQRVEDLALEKCRGIPIHGDFAPWNLLYWEGRLSGVLDFELSRRDHAVADFALSWRGKYDEVIFGYDEVSPLTPEQWASIVPIWWAELIEVACRSFRTGGFDLEWAISKLLTRSPIMGEDATELPQ